MADQDDPKRGDIPLCGAKTRAEDGHPCQQPGTGRGGRCHYHGGASLAGVASPSFKTGRWSKCIPTRLAARYRESENDPELFTLRSEVAALDARLEELFGRLDTGESGAIWRDLRKAVDALMTARQNGDPELVAEALTTIVGLVRRGDADERQWTEIKNTIRDRARAVSEERRHAAVLQTMIPAEQALAMMARLLDVVKQNVPDRDALNRIANEVDRLSRVDDSRAN